MILSKLLRHRLPYVIFIVALWGTALGVAIRAAVQTWW